MSCSFKEFDVFITVTGFNNFPNAKRLLEGDKVMLCREPENEFDAYAISVFSEFGKIGYVANSEKTVRKGTLSATKLSELIDNKATAMVVEGGYYEAICKVDNLSDIDKIILKACKYYNSGDYADAIDLFLKIAEKYSSLLLMQYTADCLIKLGRFEESLNFSKQAIEFEPDNKISLMMYATALHKLKMYNQAAKYYAHILKICENEKVRNALNECINLSQNDK